MEDDRAERQLVVIAEENQDWELSTYTWTRDDLAMPALQRYLAQAAKIRYQRRVWAGGDQVRDLIAQSRVRANELVRWVEAGPPSPGLSRPSPPFARHSSDPAARVRHLHADFLRLVSASSELAAISHSVEIAESNMRAILREDVDKTTQHDPFADDLELAGHFIVEIADDLTYLEAATTHARETLVAVERAVLGWPQITALEGIGAGSARSPANGTVHTDSGHTDARARICDAMSGLFATITDRSQLLARIGIPRHRLPEIQAGNSWQWWWEVLEELDKGLVVDPYPRLIAAARATYPGNHLLAQLAAEHGLDGTFGE